MGIRAKLVWLCVFLSVLTAVMGAYGLWNQSRLAATYQHIVDVNLQSAKNLKELVNGNQKTS